MGFEVYLDCFGDTKTKGISRTLVRSLFPVAKDESEPNYWRVRYDKKNSCEIGLTPLTSNPEMLAGLFVNRPCADLRLWDGLVRILQMGCVVIFWPGGPPVVAEGTPTSDLPKDMIDSIGKPKSVSSAAELLRLVQE
ncbi:MAG: hypothetical protein WA639_21830 [Candidatus Acidiferrum sp.]